MLVPQNNGSRCRVGLPVLVWQDRRAPPSHQVRRHAHRRTRLGREGCPELHHFHILRRLQESNRSRSQTCGGLGALNREGHRNLNDCVHELLLRSLHNLDDWHRSKVAAGGVRRTVTGFVFGLVNACNSSPTSPRKEPHCGRLTRRRKAAARALSCLIRVFSSLLRRAQGPRCGPQAHQQVGAASHHGTPQHVYKHHSYRNWATTATDNVLPPYSPTALRTYHRSEGREKLALERQGDSPTKKGVALVEIQLRTLHSRKILKTTWYVPSNQIMDVTWQGGLFGECSSCCKEDQTGLSMLLLLLFLPVSGLLILSSFPPMPRFFEFSFPSSVYCFARCLVFRNFISTLRPFLLNLAAAICHSAPHHSQVINASPDYLPAYFPIKWFYSDLWLSLILSFVCIVFLLPFDVRQSISNSSVVVVLGAEI